MNHLMLSGTGTDLSKKLEEVLLSWCGKTYERPRVM